MEDQMMLKEFNIPLTVEKIKPQKGDLEKAGTYIAGGMDEANLSKEDDGFSEKIFKPIGESYEFEKPKEKSVKGDNAKVDVKNYFR
ncbi:hypothetical protein [Rummeliibacillus sp. TYF005]|uniref:hypothetical protein n=1 Tax=Rummeliibacillus sp. TYF005 TaxID=2058214 RepID=UPI001F14C5A0|nr:hypothetical protein [Rummeliibacillus sp. TYF005]